MRNYTNKVVYMGIDIHKKTYSLTSICDKEVIKRDTIMASPEKLLNYITRRFKGASLYTAYEAGFSGFHLHRFLIEKGIKNIVVHPASIEISSRDRVKTDKRDSFKIATQLSNGVLKGIQVLSKKREHFRIITRARDQFVESRKRVGNQLKSLLFLHGLMDPEETNKIHKAWVKRVLTFNMAEEMNYSIKLYAEEWLRLEEKIAEITKHLMEQAKSDQEIDRMYRAVPGVGALSARILANELDDMSHFSNQKQLFSYTGLTPSEYSSGEHRRQGNISRQGKAILRKILVQVAWRAIRQDGGLQTFFNSVAKRSGKKRAIVAVARKLIGRIRATFMSGEMYLISPIAH